MGVQGVNSQNQLSSSLLPTGDTGQGLYAVNRGNPLFDSFELARTQPNLEVTLGTRIKQSLFHPFQTLNMTRRFLKGSQVSEEGFFGRIKMYREVRAGLDRKSRRQLDDLLTSGVLMDMSAENGHSTLHQLYATLKTKRASGLENKKILSEVVGLLNKPYTITQKFSKLSENAAKQILQVRNSPTGLNRTGVIPVVQPLNWSDIDVKNSATCVSASIMYYMAEKSPGELARQLNELTSPMRAFYEKAQLSEISPNVPEKAFEILDEAQIKYSRSGSNDVLVKVELPPAGYIRTVNASNHKGKAEARTGVEAAYQSALSFMATRRTYDPATDYRDSEIPGEMSKGLTEQEKTLMETIIKDNGGVMSITYQLAAGKSEPGPGEEGLPFLYGYTRTFEQTTADIMEVLKHDEFVTIGITDTDQSGAIVGGHEITLVGIDLDDKGEIIFKVADSDDRIRRPVIRTARELIPRIHHAGMPLKIAQQIQADIETNQGYFVPTADDQTFYNPINRTMEALPADAFGVLPGVNPVEAIAQAPVDSLVQPTPLDSSLPVMAPIEKARAKNPQRESANQTHPREGAGTPESYIEYVPVYNMPAYSYGRPVPISSWPPSAPVYNRPGYNLATPSMAMPPQPFYYPPGYGY